MGEPWDQLGGLQSQLGGLQSQLGGPLSQAGLKGVLRGLDLLQRDGTQLGGAGS